jgi:hypothetical protein
MYLDVVSVTRGPPIGDNLPELLSAGMVSITSPQRSLQDFEFVTA